MKILFISNDLIAGHLAYLLKNEGNEVRLYIDEEERRQNLHNLVDKTADWKKELDWVGKDGLIIFDDVGFGAEQDALREKGYLVFGGSERGDRLEKDREYGQGIFAEYGMKLLPTKNFTTPDEAIEYVIKNPSPWVIKQNGALSKSINYVGYFEDGRDVIDVLRIYKKNKMLSSEKITLQKRVKGIEIAVTRYFNGKDWLGPMLLNVEHKKFFPGDIGPTTSEMGTIGWYEKNEKNKIYKETLGKLKPYLQEAGYRGFFDINCIVNSEGIYPIEATSRIGSPIVHLQTELNISTWSEILLAIAKGVSYKLKYNNGYGLVIAITTPPFPYSKKIEGHSLIGTPVYFSKSMTEKEKSHIHFEEISWDSKNNYHYISDDRGYMLYVTEHAKSMSVAQSRAYSLINKIHIPKMIYRNDIGTSFIKENKKKLKKWGYI